MASRGGFITLHRKIINWEWYRNVNTKVLFIHLLLIASYENTRFMGKTIKRGQVVTSLPALATGTCLSIRQVRTALDHLILTGEVTNKSTNQYRIITIVKYDDYQKMTDDMTGKRQANDRQIDRQMTDELTPLNQYNKENKYNKVTTNKRGAFAPPTPDKVNEFCQSKGIVIDIDRFMDYYTSNGWMVGRNRMKDWKAAVRNWARRDRQTPVRETRTATLPAQEYHQRDYSDAQEAAFQRMLELGGDD